MSQPAPTRQQQQLAQQIQMQQQARDPYAYRGRDPPPRQEQAPRAAMHPTQQSASADQ